ncbi:mitochondrial tRNA-specific 2-thiouridylase 1-like [Amphiura filiformis]|uniref:mitochondrial tRNA-specific 2-thiouridylase 1-like n=1 Tax=Amphiura filiformis TaxID=82378 RepID=UPI003B215456
MMSKVKHVVCAMSGGVDSSVAALLMRKKGYNVTGLFMRNWDVLDETGECAADRDCEDAQFVCQKLNIPFREVNFVKEYWNNVFSDFLRQYQNGMTPNPDILCNKHIKFDKFIQYAIEDLGADALATGHYARTEPDILNVKNWKDHPQVKGIKLLKAIDTWKDQTFFLSQITQDALHKTTFPLGELTKDIVKKIAEQAGLQRIVKRKESMGICFIGERNFNKFIKEYVEPQPGQFVSIEDNKIIGQHEGHFLYTIGQRAKLGGLTQAWFVVDKNPNTNDVFVAPNSKHPALYCESLVTGPVHWIHQPPRKLLQDQMMDCGFRFQHSDPLVDCTLTLSGMGSVIVSLSRPLRAITPGQYAVFYLGDECLGSGVIVKPGPSLYTLNWKKYQSGQWKPEFGAT